MCITEYDEAWTMELFKKEGREERREEGRTQVMDRLVQYVKNRMLSAADAAFMVNMMPKNLKGLQGSGRCDHHRSDEIRITG